MKQTEYPRMTPDFSTGAIGRMEFPSTDLGKTEGRTDWKKELRRCRPLFFFFNILSFSFLLNIQVDVLGRHWL